MEKSSLKSGDNKKTVVQEIIGKIASADSILVTLPQDPSVDNLAAAIGLTMAIDKMGKRATAIYSGETPNALGFLRPEETFDKDAVGLQDFVIAINKDKADHLRYKLDGDYVKVFITPYKTSITERDLEFSYGDFNVDLVITLDVTSEQNLDSALMEYGRILHDASIVNISVNSEAKFGEMVWCEPGASSICEMVTGLLGEMSDKVELDQDIATALLTGIVARTERFSNALTTPEVMTSAAKLMAAGADQQLISANMVEMMVSNANKAVAMEPEAPAEVKPAPQDPSVMDIQHSMPEAAVAVKMSAPASEAKSVEASIPATPAAASNDVESVVDSIVNKTEASMGDFQLPSAGGAQMENKDDAIASILAKASQAAPEEQTSPEVASIINSIASNLPQDGGLPVNAVDVDQVIEKSVTDSVLKKEKPAPVAEPKMPTGKEGEYVGGNPALLATPGVNNSPVPDVPMMSFDNAVTERKEKVLPEESFLKAPDAKLEKPKALNESRVVIQPIGNGIGPTSAVTNAGVKSGILPPPAVNNANPGVLPMPGDAVTNIPTPPPLAL